LAVDGVNLPQSISIARYLAREFNLAGKNNLEQAKADVVVDTCLDLLNLYFSKGLYKIDRNVNLTKLNFFFFLSQIFKFLG
jgi:hypothetical protein